ncbi:MAG: DNA starvation/stationary phase protection protein [Actinomyces sp.]|jgi:starvation-inducible DNA-binding protein|nr:DNA starvation/stationary phase protection protein [Actinomyces sp.]MCI1642153.1 DNA starvation/stationary phase protection protein [Actinomyces sp.]MCI1662393.1 DNA starvation/stationary phase protection protein [Actinomyces sp.]MCI1691251.1 DNA starvation/stationary phase protection protein [Actinomyces sp.]MCI1788061.1 DNA starvation/stationary phase protection protein [Actinomyces sp.]MCI1830454.1 DNA starvation/stationary phase protection protein [Actinomyces sp.]
MSTTLDVPRQSGVTETTFENAESGFKASAALGENLQKVLVDLIALELVGKQAHWNIVGPNFRDLHHNLDDVVDIAREGSDEFAERMRALHATPDGRPAVVASTNTLAEFPNGEILTHEAIDRVVSAVGSVTATMRAVHDAVDAEDPTTADILHTYIQRLEQQVWFLSAETRTPSK